MLKNSARLAVIIAAAAAVLFCASPLLAQTYIVQKGDTLFSIGKKFGVTVNEIKAENGLDSDTIYTGQKLWIAEGLVYTVKIGDTLFSIAQKYGVPYQELMRMNGFSTSNIYPGQKIYVTANRNNYPAGERTLKSRYILGFYVDGEKYHPDSFGVMETNSDQLSAIVPFWYRLSPTDGAAVEVHSAGEGPAAVEKNEVIRRAHENNVQVFALVHNLLYPDGVKGEKLASDMLLTPDTRSRFVNQLENLIKENGYDGVNLDIEHVYPNDRDKFSSLVGELYRRLAPQGYKVTVCVPAKKWDDPANTWSGPFDYEAIGRNSHYVVLMTYDEHGYSSGPGPVASCGWVSDVAGYACEKIPPEKILLGIPGYGFDWEEGGMHPAYLSYPQAVETAVSRGVGVSWDDRAKVPYFFYRDDDGRNHQVWFENASSLTHKLEIVDRYALRGIAVWRLGLEDPGVWAVLKSKVEAVKDSR